MCSNLPEIGQKSMHIYSHLSRRQLKINSEIKKINNTCEKISHGRKRVTDEEI
jgi:hypothetical protein